jgi:hypothetical protein
MRLQSEKSSASPAAPLIKAALCGDVRSVRPIKLHGAVAVVKISGNSSSTSGW